MQNLKLKESDLDNVLNELMKRVRLLRGKPLKEDDVIWGSLHRSVSRGHSQIHYTHCHNLGFIWTYASYKCSNCTALLYISNSNVQHLHALEIY